MYKKNMQFGPFCFLKKSVFLRRDFIGKQRGQPSKSLPFKGQLISKCIFGVIVWTKKPMIFLRISVLASKKSLNQKLYHINYDK